MLIIMYSNEPVGEMTADHYRGIELLFGIILVSYRQISSINIVNPTIQFQTSFGTYILNYFQ